jgi:Raf kinase inhibitor-like YbhB/YbcL family protein
LPRLDPAASFRTVLRPEVRVTLLLTSPSFEHGGEIPIQHTCDGADLSPALVWSGVPSGTRSLALIVEDPDAPDPAAPTRLWVHWILYDMPPVDGGLPEGVAPADLPPGTRTGMTDSGSDGWHGPCPPIGRHRYYFHLYAFDTMLGDLRTPTRAKLLNAAGGHLLARVELMGTHQREGR